MLRHRDKTLPHLILDGPCSYAINSINQRYSKKARDECKINDILLFTISQIKIRYWSKLSLGLIPKK